VRTLQLIVLVLALTLVAIGCGDSDDYESTTLTLESPPLDFEVIDQGAQGSSRGDVGVLTTPLFEQDSDREAGRLDGTGTIATIEERGGEQVELRASVVQFTLEDGNMVVAGVFEAPTRARVPTDEGVTRPILGGTGAYRGARGELTQTQLPDGGQRHEFDIETPSD
jgi:hypothetical protein